MRARKRTRLEQSEDLYCFFGRRQTRALRTFFKECIYKRQQIPLTKGHQTAQSLEEKE